MHAANAMHGSITICEVDTSLGQESVGAISEHSAPHCRAPCDEAVGTDGGSCLFDKSVYPCSGKYTELRRTTGWRGPHLNQRCLTMLNVPPATRSLQNDINKGFSSLWFRRSVHVTPNKLRVTRTSPLFFGDAAAMLPI